MQTTLILTGDINLMGLADPAVPFSRVAGTFKAADVVFGNLECCLYQPPGALDITEGESAGYEGFYAPPAAGQALQLAGYHGVGNANNQNYGAEAIMTSNANLDALGIAHTGTGENIAAARAPVVLERKGVRCGFIQRTSQYWPNNHEAGKKFPGVAVMKAHTAYQPRVYKDGKPPPNRPGAPPLVITWMDPDYLQQLRQDIQGLRQQADIVVSSHHWGYGDKVLQYQTEMGRAAIDAGADVVMGHGPHHALGIEIYKGKPIFYGLGSFCFYRSYKKRHLNWVGMMARITFTDKQISKIGFSLVRQEDNTEIVMRLIADEAETVAHLEEMSQQFGSQFERSADEVIVRSGNG